MSLRKEKETAVASSTDLFGWLDALYTKKTPDGTPPTYMMHRFMASDKDLAIFARYLQLEVREAALVFRTWQGLLPTGRGAPRFSYVVPKKRPEEEELVTRMKSVLSERREIVEKMIEIVQLAGRMDDLYHEFGIDTGKPYKSTTPSQEPPKRSGLLSGLNR